MLFPLMVCLLSRAVGEEDRTAKFFEGLRCRRLFSLAEGFCLRQLARKDLTPTERADVVLEYSKTLAEHARHAIDEERPALWKRAVQVIDEFQKADLRNPKRPFLDVQRAMVAAIHGEFLRSRVELLPDEPKSIEQADAALAAAIPRFRELERSLDRSSTGSRAGGLPKQYQLSASDRRKLLRQVRYQLGLLLLEQARHAPADSPIRSATLIDAEKRLQPTAAGSAGGLVTWRSQVALAEISRLRGEAGTAAKRLNAIERKRPPRDILDQVIAERVRLLLDAGKPADAAQLLIAERARRSDKRLPGELRYLKLQATVALWELAVREKEPLLAANLLKTAATIAERADREIGGYWAYRCRLLIQRTEETRRYGPALAPQIRKARALFAARNTTAALAAYVHAVEMAREAGKSELAAELEFTQASILLQRGEYEQAGNVFGRLASRKPAGRQTAPAHLLWAYCLGRLYDRQRSKARRIAYTTALTEHRQRFASDPTAAEATWMLAQLEESRLQWTQAISLYAQIPHRHRREPEARLGVARCYELVIDYLRRNHQPVGEWEQSGIDRLERYVSLFPPSPRPLNLTDAKVELRLARIYLNREFPEYSKADRLLERLLVVSESAGTASVKQAGKSDVRFWKSLRQTAAQLRIVSLAGQRKVAQATTLVRKLADSGPAEVLAVLDGLTRAAVNVNGSTRTGLGELQLQAAEPLVRRRKQLTATQQSRLDHCLAEAYAATDRSRRAITIYAQLLQKSPRDRDLLTTIAQLRMRCGTPECLKAATTNWRALGKLNNPGSRDWLRARYQVALCSYRLKNYDECHKLLTVTRLLYPDLGGRELKAKYTALEHKLKGTRPSSSS